jgi:hypothetical protein
MLDPQLTLALALHNGKGVYALLLGSGVSRSAGIPTGWEIVLDLIRKLAHLKGEQCNPDPESWYRTLTGTEPDYSDMLDQVTNSSAERGQLLRTYFEPTEEERQEGQKVPTQAHHAIATLVAKGYIRVIVTTNFDRLLEQALSQAGVQATLISTADAVRGAMPITHSPCTIIKVHGDYLDSRIKNTRIELSEYDAALNALVDRIFDEFGLIVCGWSAEWDTALRAALERCSTHRFGTYWSVHGQINSMTEKLIGIRRATVLPIAEADSFFRNLADKVQALEDYAITDPVSPRVAVARIKRYLATPEQHINLHDLVNAETERVHLSITASRFSAEQSDITPEIFVRRLREYEGELQSLLPMLACGAYWGTKFHKNIILSAVKRIAEDHRDQKGLFIWLNLRRYPALLLFYALGIAAVARGNYEMLRHLFAMNLRANKHKPEQPITEVLAPMMVLDRDVQRQFLPGRERDFTPLNDYIFELLREPLREYLPADLAYDDTFDWFEYLLGLVHCNQSVTTEQLDQCKTDGEWYIRGPVGRFIWNRSSHPDGSIEIRTELRSGELYPERIAAALRAGLFGSGGTLNDERYRLIKRGFDAFLSKYRSHAGIW